MGNLAVKYKICIIYTTIDSHEKAVYLAKEAISKKLAKCINIIDKVESIYEWEGQIESSKEYIMIFKTLLETQEKLKEFIKQNHIYELPAIICFEPTASEEYYNYLLKV